MNTGTDEFGTPYDQTEFPMSEGKMETISAEQFHMWSKWVNILGAAAGDLPPALIVTSRETAFAFAEDYHAYASRAAAGTTTGGSWRIMAIQMYRALQRLHLAVKGCAGIGFQESSPTTNAHHASVWGDLNEAQKNAEQKLKYFSVATVAPVEAKPDVCPQCGSKDPKKHNKMQYPGSPFDRSKCAHPFHSLRSSKPPAEPTLVQGAHGYVTCLECDEGICKKHPSDAEPRRDAK